MPGKVKVKIISGRNLPVMDRSSDTTDAYVEIKLGSTTYKTDVCRKSLHPQWNTEWYRFDVDDSELQDEPLQIRLMDHDTYSANDAIGKVYLNLNPLLLPAASLLQKWNGESRVKENMSNTSMMSGWLPVYDTMHGIRGEVDITVKVEHFSDFNKFRQSSCGIQFFCSPAVPHGFYAQMVHGFVEELVVNDDPEYQWIDKIRTPRASNEARQTLFCKLSGEVQRKIGVKALDLGGNAVIGYRQSFDLEGESGIVARGIGTAVTLVKIMDHLTQNAAAEEYNNEERALNYLNFLGSANGFFLPNITNTFDVSNNPCFAGSLAFLLPRALRTPPPSLSDIHSPHTAHHTKNKHRHMTRHLSDKELLAKHADSHLHHSVSLQTLLKQEDMRGSGGGGGGRRNGNPTGYRISHRFWKFKHASHAKLAKRITHLKAKLSETTLDETAVSPDSERPLNYKYRRTQSDSTGGMAEILVRSVIHAANSLDCIAESPSVSPALLQAVHNKPISEENLVPSVSYLSLPGTSIGSVSSKTSSSSSSSSGEDDLDETVMLDNISDIVENARKLSMIKDVHPTRILEPPIIISDSSPVPILNRKTRNENTKNLFFLELENDITDGDDGVVDYSDTVSEPVNFSPGKDEYDMGSFIYSDENGRSITELPEVDTETESLIPETETLVHNDTVLGVPFTNIFKKDDTVKNFYRRSISHNINQAYVDESLPRSVKNHHQSHETVLGIPFTNIFQHNNHNNNAETSSDHPSAVLHIEREYEVSERIPLPPKGMNKSATTICLNELCSADSQHHSHVRKHHQSHETLVTIPFGSMYTTHEHVTVQFPETIREGAVIDFTCDRTITKNAPMKKSPTITSFTEYKTQPEHHKLHKNTSLDIVCNESIDDPQLYDDIVHYYEDDPECKTVLKKTHRSIPVKMGQFMEKLRGKFKRNTDESHGLLSTALGNVLMESVNEVLATTHSEKVDAKEVSGTVTIPEREPSVIAETEIKQSPGKKTTKLSRFYSIFRRNKSTKPEIKQGGLLETALDNVLLESMNEIIATQQPTCSPTVPLFALCQPVLNGANSSQSETGNLAGPLTSTSMNNVTSGNTEYVSGVSDVFSGTNTNTLLHARLTPSRIGDPSQDFVTSSSGVTAPVSTSAAVTASTSYANHTRSLIDQNGHGGHQRAESVGTKIVPYSPARLNSIPCIHRRSSDSDLSITSKGNSLTGSDRSGGYSSGHFMRTNAVIRSTVPQENFDILEYPFLTMNKYPPGFIAFLGGAVNARSVKLLERITNIEEPESRDIWWSEIRMEIRSHARALNCNAVLGYNETTSICDEVCVLSATGTAAVIGFQYIGDSTAPNTIAIPVPHDTTVTTDPMAPMTVSLDRNDFEKDRDRSPKADVIASNTTLTGTNNVNVSSGTTTAIATPLESPEKERNVTVTNTAPVVTVTTAAQACSICHLPYTAKVAQLRNATSKCSICRSRKVPDILIATIEMPDGIPSIGRGCFLQAYVCRPLKDVRGGESNAKEISDGLPFLEYELHRLLLNKLKVKGMNAIFGLNVRISVGEKMLIGIGTGTAVFLSPLPVPPIPALRSTDEKKLAQLQKNLHDTVKKNREIYQLVNDLESTRILSDDDSEDDRPSLELTSGNKDCCILEVDDPEDVSELALLMEPRPPDGFHVVNTESVPGLEELEIVKNLQMFTQIWRSKVQHPYNLDKHFHRLLQTVYFKLRRMIPCALCDLQFRVESPEPDEIQLCVLGMALGLGDPLKNSKLKRKNFHTKRTDEELIFNIEDDLIPENSVAQLNTNLLHTQQTLKHRQKSPVRTRMTTKQHHVPYKERHGVDITPLSYVPGGKIEKYLGNLNFFFIRETNSIREEGGLSGFMHSFVTEVLAIVRSHVTALGGNAMVAYYLTECTLNHNLHKNQGQCLINVGGDVVFVTYYPEDH